MNVFISPSGNIDNEYLHITNNIISDICGVRVKGINCLKFYNIFERKRNCAILNWYEDSVFDRRSIKYRWSLFFIFILKVLYIKSLCSKVIYIKHNYKPHGSQSGSLIFSLSKYLIEKMASKKVAHTDNIDGFDFVPHPLYLNDEDFLGALNNICERSVDYFIFGTVSRYKKLHKLLNEWPENIALTIWGKCNDTELEQEICKIICERALSVTWRNEFIDIKELNSKLLTCKHVIVNNDDSTMIASGVFYHAISFGCNVLVNKSAFSYFAKKKHGNICAEYTVNNLESVLKINNFHSVDSSVLDISGRQSLAKKWAEMIFK
ncbi:hypothetical protein [Shewanella marisflavi]|uniref:Uncharacterized protein n=1 Tax=Shewanella marisflavi TaxID=260364 RepID=A0AAC9U127_9GAMM|nr:hypothetical protein [Shewanella marisflavi]ASJ97324.1 hypothetical protein CFF01_12460 [Shewanella marisflavi]